MIAHVKGHEEMETTSEEPRQFDADTDRGSKRDLAMKTKIML